MDAYIISLNPTPQVISMGQLGLYTIAPAKKDGTPTATPIPDKKLLVDKGADVYEERLESGMGMAVDISQRYADKGLYASELPSMTPDVLELAKEQFHAACVQKVMSADGLWEKFHRRDLISDEARMAARYIGSRPEWLDPTSSEGSGTCPVCASRINAGAIRCKECGEVLDPQKYADFKASLSPTTAAPPPLVKRG